jgi:hypothetical protein
MQFSSSEIVVKQEPNLHIIKGRREGSDNYRAELRKIDDEHSEFVFGTVSNSDDYYVCVLRCKLYTCAEEKVAFITDLRGFADNLWEPIEVYRLNTIENYWRRSQYNLDLFDLSLKRMMVGWDIRKYDEDRMLVFELSRNIFNNVLFYPRDLDALIPRDIINKIHDLNRPAKINIQVFDEAEIMDLWRTCEETRSDHGILAVWFGLHKDYEIFGPE